MSFRQAALAALFALSACSHAPAAAPQGGIVILPREAVADMYDQCSRSTPPAATDYWRPEPQDIARMESVLLESAAEQAAARGLDLSIFSARWRRQYVGTVRDGRRFIYGNFYRAGDEFPEMDWQREPVRVCDGGPDFFGAEFDMDAGTITHIAFNGSMSKPARGLNRPAPWAGYIPPRR